MDDKDHDADNHREADDGRDDEEDERCDCDALGPVGERLTRGELAEASGPCSEDGPELAKAPRSGDETSQLYVQL